MRTMVRTYPSHLVREQLSEYGYRENHRSEGKLHFRHHIKGTFISLPIDRAVLTDDDLRLALGESSTYYDIVWRLGK